MSVIKDTNIKDITKYATVVVIILVVAILVNMRMKYMDIFYFESNEPGYVYEQDDDGDGLRLIAEGLKLNYLYAGQYVVTISHSPAQHGDYCEVVDLKTGDVLAQKEYSTDGNSTSVLIKAGDRIDSMSVKSYCRDKIAISGYVIKSNGAVYTDTHWLRRVLFVYVIALAAGYYAYKKKGARFLQLLLFATVCSMPLWTQTIPTGHDVAFNYTRYRGIVEGLRLHEFPVRINGAFYHGAGYLVDLMYPGMIQYPFAFMSSHGASTLFSFKMMLIASVFATVFCSYYPLKRILGDKTACIFMFVYTLNPFRLNELYVRCALGEYLAMIFLPLVFAGIYQLVLGDYKIGFYEASSGITLVFLSHLLSILFVVVIAVAAYVLLLIFTKFEILKDIKRDITIILCAILTLVINMWFWVPMLDYYNPNYCIASFHGNISNSMIYLFGAFMDGFTNPDYYNGQKGLITNASATYSVGIIMLICVCIYLYRRFIKREVIQNRNILDFSLLMGSIALFIESDLFPWKYLEEKGNVLALAFGKLQFLWRFQMIVAIMFGVVAAGIMYHLLKERKEVFWCLFFLLIVNAGWLSRGYLFENGLYQVGKFNVPESAMNGDYLESSIDYTKVGLYLQSGEGPFSDDNITINNARRDGIDYSFEVINTTGNDATIVVPVIYSGFYEASVNGVLTSISNDDDTSLMKLVLNGTDSSVNVNFHYREPDVYRFLELVSLISFISFVGISLILLIRKRISLKQQRL